MRARRLIGGEPASVEGRARTDAAGDGGGVLMNQGIHEVDLLVWYMGDPVAVQASAATLHRDAAWAGVDAPSGWLLRDGIQLLAIGVTVLLLYRFVPARKLRNAGSSILPVPGH